LGGTVAGPPGRTGDYTGHARRRRVGRPGRWATRSGGGPGGRGVDHQAHAADLVGHDAVGGAIPDHEVRHVDAGAVDEAGDEVAGAIEFSDGAELILVQEALGEGAVDGLADAAVHTVDDVLDDGAVGLGDLVEVAEDVVLVVGGAGGVAAGRQPALGVAESHSA